MFANPERGSLKQIFITEGYSENGSINYIENVVYREKLPSDIDTLSMGKKYLKFFGTIKSEGQVEHRE